MPPKAEILCRSHHTARCAECCHFILSGTVIVCTHCASSFHHYCQQPNQACASCGSSNSSYVTTVRCGKHRNLSGILQHCGLNQSASTAPTTNASIPTVRNIRGHCASTTVLPTTNSQSNIGGLCNLFLPEAFQTKKGVNDFGTLDFVLLVVELR